MTVENTCSKVSCSWQQSFSVYMRHADATQHWNYGNLPQVVHQERCGLRQMP